MQREIAANPGAAPRIGVKTILKEAFALYTSRFGPLMLPALVIYAPVLLLMIGILSYLIGLDGGSSFSADILLGLLGMYGFLFLILLVEIFVGYPALYAQYSALLYPKSTGRRALRFAFSRYGKAMGAVFASLLLGLGASLVGQVLMTPGTFLFSLLAGSLSYAYPTDHTAFLIGAVVYTVMWSLGVAVLALTVQAASCLTIPASAKLELTMGKALKYSIRRSGPALISHILIALLYGLCVFVVSMLAVLPVLFLSFDGAMSPGSVSAAMIGVFLLILVLAVFGQAFLVAVNCAIFRLVQPANPPAPALPKPEPKMEPKMEDMRPPEEQA